MPSIYVEIANILLVSTIFLEPYRYIVLFAYYFDTVKIRTKQFNFDEKLKKFGILERYKDS